MRTLKDNLFDSYEMHAQGKVNCRAAEQISDALTQCIVVDEIVSTANKGMIIRFIKSREFNQRLDRAKERIVRRKEKELRR